MPITVPNTMNQEITLFDLNHIKVIYRGMIIDKVLYQEDLYVENYSDEEIEIRLDDFSINEFYIPLTYSKSTIPSKRKYLSKVVGNFCGITSELSETGITKIDDIDFTFRMETPSRQLMIVEPMHIAADPSQNEIGNSYLDD